MLQWTSKHCCGRTNFPNCNDHVKGKSVADEILLPGHNEMLLSQVKRISQMQVLLRRTRLASVIFFENKTARTSCKILSDD